MVSLDSITAPLRLKIDTRFGHDSALSKLVWCYWCSGWWVAGLTCTLTLVAAVHLKHLPLTTAVYVAPLLWPAVAYAASWILDKEEN